MLMYVQWTGTFVLFLLLFGFIMEEKTRLEAAKNYMVEYLENVCIHRYAKMNHAKSEEEVTADIAVSTIAEEHEEEQNKPEETNVETPEVSQEEQRNNEQEMRIRAILEEFLA